MGIEERLQVLEEESQLVRGELKQTLVNVRDFLLDLNLPALQEEDQREIHEHNETHSGEGGPDKPSGVDGPPPMQPQSAPAPASLSSTAPPPPMPQPINQAAPPSMSQITTIGQDRGGPPPPTSFSRDEIVEDRTEATSEIEDLGPFADDIEETFESPQSPAPQVPTRTAEPAGEIEEAIEEVPDQFIDNEPMGFSDVYEEPSPEVSLEADEPTDEEPVPLEPAPMTPHKPEQKQALKMQPVVDRSSQINLLTNLIRWVTVARKEIGIDYLPAFLDVYGIGDQLSEETREIITYLADTISPRAPQDPVTTQPPVDETETGTGGEGILDDSAGAEQEPEQVHDIPPAPVQPDMEPNGEIWNRMILELHGILRCSNVSFEVSQLPWKRTVSEPAKSQQAAECTAEDTAGINSTGTPEASPDTVDIGPPAGTEHEDEAVIDETAGTLIEDPEDMPADPPDMPEDPAIDTAEIEEADAPKKKSSGRSKTARKKQAGQEPAGARLKLVIPVGDDQETEIEIGAFNLSLNRSNDSD